jgi:hypothetical protein
VDRKSQRKRLSKRVRKRMRKKEQGRTNFLMSSPSNMPVVSVGISGVGFVTTDNTSNWKRKISAAGLYGLSVIFSVNCSHQCN